VLSAVEASRSLLDAEAVGANEYLLKPIELASVREAIRRQLFRPKVPLGGTTESPPGQRS
jgi:hypothetical protein